MKISRFNIWEKLRTNLWFVPVMMTIGAAFVSIVLIGLDVNLKKHHDSWLYQSIYSGGPEGARALLSTIAGSLITVVGVTFSVTVVALSLASQQYGPRLLRNFMKDRVTQIVLGNLISTYVYCLLILRVIRQGDDAYVPKIAVTFGFILALVSLFMLIYFIHHLAKGLQASQIIGGVASEIKNTTSRLYPDDPKGDDLKHGLESHKIPDFKNEGCPVITTSWGYVESIDNQLLLHIAAENDLVFQVNYLPGDFVGKKSVLGQVWPNDRSSEELIDELNGCFTLEPYRTPVQDIEFGLLQLSEIAVRALSAGINDPYTAMNCIDQLGVALSRIAGKNPMSPFHYIDGKLRVMARERSFDELVDGSFLHIRRAAREHPIVLKRILEALSQIGSMCPKINQRQPLKRHALMIANLVKKQNFDPDETAFLEVEIEKTQSILDS